MGKDTLWQVEEALSECPKEHENILIEDPEDGIRRIVLNRPNKRNALSNSLRKELFSALEEADQDKQVKVIILSGAGKCFSAV
ncbi:MAG: hypothetical protein Ct9H90mP4_09470 [Gammaproteobacteria bacterium]|nr:MAG: hypothetical protein Ct9H90mP4_09470 [Gammaproteobacteria bacterium]